MIQDITISEYIDAGEGVVMRMYGKGDRVWQATYGTGTVIGADSQHTIIDFDAHGVRTFSTPIVTLSRTTVPAPARPVPKRRSRRTLQRRDAIARR